MTILGIHSGHDANCCLVRDGAVVADAQEERFARVKHSANVPLKALEYCLRAGGVSDVNDVDSIAIASRELSPGLSALFGIDIEPDARPRAPLKPPTYFRQVQLSDPTKVSCVEHHLAHASAAHFTRRTGDRCLVFTLDGMGDGVSVAVWEATGNKIIPLQRIGGRASIAWAYSTVTEALGWRHGDGEGKTMGLASYGDAARCRGVLDKYFPIVGVAGVEKPLGLGPVYRWHENGGTHWHFDEATEIRALVERHSAADVAAEAQHKLEQGVLKLLREWIDATGIRRIACSGGLFQNVKLNQRVWADLRGTIQEQHIFPNPGDAGLAVGAALWAYYKDRPFTGTDLSHLSWGPRYSAHEIERLVHARHIGYEKVEDPSARAAALLAEGKIVGWFQGGSTTNAIGGSSRTSAIERASVPS